MIKVITNNLGSGDWITVIGNGGSVLFSGHRVGANDLCEILNIISRDGYKLDGCELVEVTDEQMEEEYS